MSFFPKINEVLLLAYVFPFVFAFAQNSMEVRLAINGNLLATSYFPGVKLLASKVSVQKNDSRTKLCRKLLTIRLGIPPRQSETFFFFTLGSGLESALFMPGFSAFATSKNFLFPDISGHYAFTENVPLTRPSMRHVKSI